MEHDDNEEIKPHKCSCNTTHAQSIWVVGGAVILLVTLFCFAMFRSKDNTLPALETPVAGQQVAGQQVALVPPACATCPTAPTCFPPAATGGQQIAFAPNCAQQVAYAPNCAQQVAFPNNQMRAPLTALGQRSSVLRCPKCGYAYNDSSAAARGFSRCPRCGVVTQLANQRQGTGGLMPVALTNPTGAPPIFRDAVMLHAFRGVCENCHTVNPDIAIPAAAKMVHEFRGVCSNCHVILGLSAGAK